MTEYVFIAGLSTCVCVLSVPEGGPSDVSEGVADCGLVQRCGSVL